jgi:hypothetical protein
MKEFRKNQKGLFICEECGKICKDKTVLSIHNIKIHKLSPKEYFDKWIKEKGEGICKICNKETKLIRSDWGYKNTCSKMCANIYSGLRSKEEIFKKYGVENVYQLESIKLKCKQTKKERYGDEMYQNREQIEQTNIKRFGKKYPLQSKEIQDKIKQSNLENYGVEYSWQRKDIKNNIKHICLERFGVEHPSQNLDILNKGFKTRFQFHNYLNTNLIYQSSYELDFLEKYYDKYLDIQRGFSIKYEFNGKNKIYHSDFFIPSLNLIVEIKNSYLAKKDKDEIEAKKIAVLNKGYNFILIIDKKYDDLNNIVL